MSALAGIALKWLLDPRVLGALAVAGVVGLGWWHYTGLRDDLATARTELAAAKTAMEAAVSIAEQNAQQLEKAEAQHRAALTAMEEAYTELIAATDAAREAEADVRSAPESEDGPVAPLLDDLRKNRFGGQ